MHKFAFAECKVCSYTKYTFRWPDPAKNRGLWDSRVLCMHCKFGFKKSAVYHIHPLPLNWEISVGNILIGRNEFQRNCISIERIYDLAGQARFHSENTW